MNAPLPPAASYLLLLVLTAMMAVFAGHCKLDKGGDGPDAKKTTWTGWSLFLVSYLLGAGVGNLPGLEGRVESVLNTIGIVQAPVAPAVSAPAPVANPLTPSKEGIALMDKYFPGLKYELVGRKIQGFVDVGNGWYWCVVDPSADPNTGQHVFGDSYTVADTSVTEVQVFLAKKVSAGGYEFGDRRPFSLR